MPSPNRREHLLEEHDLQSDWLIDVVRMLATYAHERRLGAVEARLEDVIDALQIELGCGRPLH